MDDAELLGLALVALKNPTLDSRDLQRRIAARLAARLAEVYAALGPSAAPAGKPGLDQSIPTLPGR